jgi:hypothetical protein
VRPGEYGKAYHINVFLQRRADNHFGRLPQAGVDHLEAGITKRSSDDFCAAIVPVETGLGDEYANAFRHQTTGSS